MKRNAGIVAAIIAAVIALSLAGTPTAEAHAETLAAGTVKASQAVGQKLPPNANKVVKGRDGNRYALYKGRVAALTGIKRHAKTITVPRYVKYRGQRYEVVAIHEVGLFERVDVKRVRILAKNLETVEEPALFKDWRMSHGKRLKVDIKYKAVRQWLNARW